jgi:hypothetical protein
MSRGRLILESDRQLNEVSCQLEHALLKRLVGRTSSTTDFSFYLSFLATTQDNMIFRYCRVLEHGSLIGFAQKCMHTIQTEIVMDVQCTMDTVLQLQLQSTRPRKDDVSVCSKLWTKVSDAIMCRHDKGGFISVFAVGSIPTFMILGVEEKFIFSQWQTLKDMPQRLNLSTQMMMDWRSEQLSTNEQLDYLNCFPPQCTSSRRSLWQSWSSKSPKQKMLNGMRGKELLDYITTCRYPEANKSMHDDQLTDEHPPLHSRRHRTYTRSQTPGIQSLKSQFINKGFLRIIDTSVSGITLVWNSYDQYSGAF